MSELIREFLVQGSESSPYKVVFKRIGFDLKAMCSCKAGVNGQLCKHRLSILNGDASAVVGENIEQVSEVASWLEGSNIAEAISEVLALETEKRLIEERIKKAKKQIAKALIR